MSSLVGISQAVSELVRRVEPSVVSVESRRGCSASGIVWAKDLVVSAAHAIERDEKVHVVTTGGRRVEAERVGVFPAGDLAVLRLKSELLPLGATVGGPLEVGELVVALGRIGARLRAKLGIVSFIGGEWRIGQGVRVERYIESDISPSPAFSAGPLVRADGELIGLNSARLARGALVTLPSSTVAEVVEALVTRGRVVRAELGVAVHPVALPATLAKKLERASGLIVMSVRPESPAERAGVMLGDVLLSFGEASLAGPEELENALGEASIGRSQPLTLLRGGERLELPVEAQEKT